MSDRAFRRRNNIPTNRSTSNSRAPARPSPSPAPRRRIRPTPLEKFKTLHRSKSEPSLHEAERGEVAAEAAEEEEEDEGVLYRPWTCTDIFESPEIPVTPSPRNITNQGYNKDAKVVVNVTVEGSPGPIRAMVKLGSNVEATIKLVIDKYSEEGRTPRLNKDAASTCELHHSYFSLESLRKSDLIGDIGSRSFYLRRNDSGRSNGSRGENAFGSSNASIQLSSSTLPLLSTFVDRKIRKFILRTRKFWKIFGCLPCTV